MDWGCRRFSSSEPRHSGGLENNFDSPHAFRSRYSSWSLIHPCYEETSFFKFKYGILGLNDPALKHIAHENPPGLRVNVDVATSQQSSSILEKTKSTENPKDNESSHPVLKVNMLTCETIPVEMQPEDIGSRQAPQPTTSSNTRLSIEKKIKEVSSEVYIFEHIGAQPHDTDTSHSQQITQVPLLFLYSISHPSQNISGWSVILHFDKGPKFKVIHQVSDQLP